MAQENKLGGGRDEARGYTSVGGRDGEVLEDRRSRVPGDPEEAAPR